MENGLILVVEDEPEIARIMTAYLEKDGFRTLTATDGEQALMYCRQFKPDLLVLDLGLPKLNGFEVLARLRAKSNVPVLVATAMAEDLDKLSALRMGADDYVVKPYNPMEVVARAHAILRRGKDDRSAVLSFGQIRVDTGRHETFVDDAVVDLTLTEYRLLTHMLARPAQVHSRLDLLDASMPESDAVERTIDSHISNLRRKLVAAGSADPIRNVRGVGYCLETPE